MMPQRGGHAGTLDARLLALLRGAATHLSTAELAVQAGVNAAAVRRALAALGEAGFDIEQRPGFGHRLLGSPDRLIADDLHSRLGGSALIREILVFEETNSTNDVAARLGREGHPGGLAVFAERQTAGRGRFGRRWESQAREGLWFSLLLRPAYPAARWVRLTTWAGVGVAAAIEDALGLDAKIKWPNDVFVAGRKTAGILTESASDTTGRPFAVVGIGLNVNQESFPPGLAGVATSLRQAAGRRIDRPAFAVALLAALAARFADVDEAFQRILAEASRRSSIVGEWVRLRAGDAVFEGRAEGLDSEGALLLRTADGSLRTMCAGEVTSQETAAAPGCG
jgi:BirA family biotin operon repressor/biotin-[acetyl-CoA-carboxylase] ligase